jgi:hypothetical protein
MVHAAIVTDVCVIDQPNSRPRMPTMRQLAGNACPTAIDTLRARKKTRCAFRLLVLLVTATLAVQVQFETLFLCADSKGTHLPD